MGRCFLFILNFSGLLFAIGAVHTIIDPNIHLGPLLMLIGIGIPFFLLICICMIKCIRSTTKTKPTSTEIIDVEIREIEECDSEQLQNVKYEIDFSYSETE